MKLFKNKTIISTLKGTKENTGRKSFFGKPKVNKEDTDEVILFALEQLSKAKQLI